MKTERKWNNEALRNSGREGAFGRRPRTKKEKKASTEVCVFSVVLWLFGVQDHVFPFQYVSHKRRRRKRRVTAAAGTRRAAHSQGHQSILWSICILAAYSRSGNSSNSFISAHDMGSIWKKRGEMSIWAIGANVHDDDRKLPIRCRTRRKEPKSCALSVDGKARSEQLDFFLGLLYLPTTLHRLTLIQLLLAAAQPHWRRTKVKKS